VTADELRREIASGDEQAARRAVRACGARLREGHVGDADEILETLLPLVESLSAILRQAVADVCDAFPDGLFETTHLRLLADRDPYVRRSAEAAGHRHAQLRRQRARVESEEQALEDVLGELERRHGKGARKLAERAVERGVETFAQMLDHEVRKTKNAIYLALEELAAELERPERSLGLLRDHLATVRERSAFVFAIVLRARDYVSRPRPVFAEQGLAKLVDEARAQLLGRVSARAAKVAFTNDIDPELRADVDRHALLQALQNVLQNAVEAYGVDADRLAVRVSASVRGGGSEIELRVADEGVGIAEDRIPKLFIPFGSRKPGGTGVGMLIVRRAIEEVHGGTLGIASALGKGTTVTMVIPARQRT
jgi:signal transduction histidine kinase